MCRTLSLIRISNYYDNINIDRGKFTSFENSQSNTATELCTIASILM